MTRKSLVKAADRAFSRYIIARDGGRCVQCGTAKHPTCGHLFSRIAYSTRWNPDGAACQCAGHNLRHEHDPYPFTKYFIDLHGHEWVDKLHALWNQPVKFKDYQLIEIAKYFSGKADELAGKREGAA